VKIIGADFLHGRCAIGFLLVWFAAEALAADFKTLDGTQYNGVTVKRVEADGIVVVTDVGVEKIYFSELPKEVRERYSQQATAVAASAAATGPATISETVPVQSTAAQQTLVAAAPIAPPTATPAQAVAPMHTYELKQDYVIGGDTGAVAKRLTRGQRYRGRDVADGIKLEIDGKSYTVPRDILSAAKD
jgi:hypothetical protein